MEDRSPDKASNVRIVMDDREASSAIAVALRETPAVELTVRRLAAGDFLVENRCLFERKTWRDLTASIKDGRLFSQARRLASAATPAGFIIEGDAAAPLEQSQMRPEALEGALVCLAFVWGLPVLYAPDAATAVRYMIFSGTQLRRLESSVPLRRGKRPKGKRRAQMYLVQSLPGVGPERAARLLREFRSVAELAEATVDRLAAVQGIGRKTAQTIFDVIH